jgi:hypothetical protein
MRGRVKAFVLLLLLPVAAAAADITLQWDANAPEDAVRRYNVCWGNYSGNVKNFAFTNCSSTAKTTKTIPNISQTSKMYFRVSATNDLTTSYWSNFVYLNFTRVPSALRFQKIQLW